MLLIFRLFYVLLFASGIFDLVAGIGLFGIAIFLAIFYFFFPAKQLTVEEYVKKYCNE